MKNLICKIRGHKYEWILGQKATSWIKCSRCGKSMFGDEIGVILINWDKTDDYYNLKDVLLGNLFNNGVIDKPLKPTNKRSRHTQT